jgi:hypothetical protein
MGGDSSGARSDGGDDLTDFLNLLNELQATGCNLLVVGDARPDLFTRASAALFGDPGELRYRLLAVTDASPRSVAERLPGPDESPRPLAETTKIINHATTPRSVTSSAEASGADLTSIPEERVGDPRLEGLETALVEGIEEFDDRAGGLRPSELRVGVDSLDALLDNYGEEIVRALLRSVGESVRNHSAMAHYVLEAPYDSDRVRSLADAFDAVIEIRTVDPEEFDHDAQQRWHVPERGITTNWVPL